MRRSYKVDTGIVELLLVNIPVDLNYIRITKKGITGICLQEEQEREVFIDIENISEYSIIGKLSELSIEQVQKLVSKVPQSDKNKKTGTTWKNYSDEEILITAWQSFYSCILSHGLFTKEPKKPNFSLKELINITVDTDTPMQQYKKNIERYINPKTTLLLKKKK